MNDDVDRMNDDMNVDMKVDMNVDMNVDRMNVDNPNDDNMNDKMKFITSGNVFYINILKSVMKKYTSNMNDAIDKAFELNLFPIKTPIRFRYSKISNMSESETKYYTYQEKFLKMCSTGKADTKDYMDIATFIEIYRDDINFSIVFPKIKKLNLMW